MRVCLSMLHILFKLPKKVTPDACGVGSVVGLKLINNDDCISGYASELSVEAFGDVGVPCAEDWELGLFGIARSQLRKAPHKLIQRAPQAVEKVARNEGYEVG